MYPRPRIVLTLDRFQPLVQVFAFLLGLDDHLKEAGHILCRVSLRLAPKWP